MDRQHPAIEISGLTLAYGERIVQRNLNFTVGRGEIFIVMGGSGCGKSTLLKHLIGLETPVAGQVRFGDKNFWPSDESARETIQRRFGVLFQSGALWSSLTLLENVALPLTEFTNLDRNSVREIATLKLALVGLSGFEHFYPSEISGGMKKRAGLARAMALDPEILFFDEPSAGLDPLSSARLDELILELRASLGATIVMVTHELASIFAIGDNAIFLDAETKTMIASGPPRKLAEQGPELVQSFLARGQT